MQTQLSATKQAMPEKANTHVVKTIEGRFRPMPALLLCLSWWLYNNNHISRRQLRVYFALHEMHERRRYTKTDGRGGKRRPIYTVDEVAALVGGRGSETAIKELKADLRKLAKVGLADMSEHRIAFASSPDAVNLDVSNFWDFWDRIPNRKRSVPIPRRTLRALAAGFSKAVTGTMIAMIIRSIHWHKREGEFRVCGRTKGSWISETFGISRRSVTDARAHLIELGWLDPQDTPQVLLNRYGNHDRINITWSGKRMKEQTQNRQDNSASPQREKSGEFATPIENSPPSSLKKSQNNRNSGHVTAPDPKLVFQSGGNGVTEHRANKRNRVPLPSLRDIHIEHLRDTKALLELYDQAVEQRLIEHGDRGRLDFVAFAERARSRGHKPGALFSWLIQHRKFEFITQADEDAAFRRLREHLYGNQPRTSADHDVQIGRVQTADDRFVIGCILAGRQYKRCPFRIAQQGKGWTRVQWGEALENYELRFGQVR